MKRLILLTLIILLVPLALATTDEIRFIGQQNTYLDITEPCFNNNTYCSDTSKCNITVKDPKQFVLVNNLQMTNQNAYHNYTLDITNTSSLGVYESTVVCQDGSYNGFDTFYFRITYHGKEEPVGFTQIIFILFFVIILAGTLVSIILLIKHLELMDFDMWDLLIMIGIYFANFSLKYFNMQYMGSYIIDTFSDMFISIGAVTHLILPILIFIYCFMKRRLELKEENV